MRGGGECDDVGASEHRVQVGAIGGDGRAHDLVEVRAVGVDDVVVPVRGEQRPVRLEVALVGGDAILALENGEEIGQQVDQHLRRQEGHGRQKIDVASEANKSARGGAVRRVPASPCAV